MARVVVAGATGMIGRALTDALARRGDEVIALSRRPPATREVTGTRLVAWPDPKQTPPPRESIAGADAVVNLLGEPIAQRWTADAKREIRDSRVLGTRSLVQAIRALPADARPAVVVSQSAAGFYGPRGGEQLDESSPAGDDFLARVVVEWEREADTARGETRVVLTRTGVVLAPRAGVLERMLGPFRLGVGGPVAGGGQFVPWIHLDDVVGALLRCVDDESLRGPVNVTAPTPVTNAELSKTLGRVLHRPAVLPVPGVALRALYGEMATVVTTGQRVVPVRLREAGYEFSFPELEPALRDVIAPAGGDQG